MDGLTGFAAVVMALAIPTSAFALYTFYRVRKLRTDERLAAIQRGVTVPMEPDLTQAAHSRRAGILLVFGRRRIHARLHHRVALRARRHGR